MKVYLLYTKAVPENDKHYTGCSKDWTLEHVFASKELAKNYAAAFLCCKTRIEKRHVVREEAS